jgi:hypothetical protein
MGSKTDQNGLTAAKKPRQIGSEAGCRDESKNAASSPRPIRSLGRACSTVRSLFLILSGHQLTLFARAWM